MPCLQILPVIHPATLTLIPTVILTIMSLKESAALTAVAVVEEVVVDVVEVEKDAVAVEKDAEEKAAEEKVAMEKAATMDVALTVPDPMDLTENVLMATQTNAPSTMNANTRMSNSLVVQIPLDAHLVHTFVKTAIVNGCLINEAELLA